MNIFTPEVRQARRRAAIGTVVSAFFSAACVAAVILGGDEIAAGTVTIKDLDLGRALAASVADNQAWREGRPGQITAPRGELVAQVRRIVEAAA